MRAAFPLVLASGPKYLPHLKKIGVTPDVVSPDPFLSSPDKLDLPVQFSLRRAGSQAMAAQSLHPNAIIFSANTVIACGRRILSPINSIFDAVPRLILLSGKRHQVYTSLCLILPTGIKKHRTVKTVITFKKLSENELSDYAAGNEWMNTCGYDPEGFAGHFIKQINGSFSNVQGLPLFETYNLLQNPLGLP